MNKSNNINDISNNYKWYNLKSTKILEEYLNNIYNKNNLNKNNQYYINNNYKYNLLKRQIFCNQIYLNLVLVCIFSRYLDIPILVKNGGIKFSLTAFLFFFYFNKYYYLYNLNKRLLFQSFVEDLQIQTDNQCIQLINKIILINLEKTKEERYRNNALSKYWKEPIAWH